MAAFAAMVLPAVAIAGGAGDDQYLDPLQGLTGSNGGSKTHKPSKPKKSDGGSSSSTAPAPVAITPSTTAPVEADPKVTSKPRKVAAKPVHRPAIDINSLSGIGSLVAVPVKHVTLVLGDIAHERS